MLGLVAAACGQVADLPEEPLQRPTAHRVATDVCDSERPPGNIAISLSPDDSSLLCNVDADCAATPDCPSCRVVCVPFYDGRKRCLSDDGSQPGACLRDEDCTAGDNGRCHFDRAGARCTYDACFTDAECPEEGGPCICDSGNGGGNACLPGNCKTDADCGSDGYCSPTASECGGVVAYYCRTPDDSCVDDAGCPGGQCMYRPEVARWACGARHVCVG